MYTAPPIIAPVQLCLLAVYFKTRYMASNPHLFVCSQTLLVLLPLALCRAPGMADHGRGIPEAKAEGDMAQVQLTDVEDVLNILRAVYISGRISKSQVSLSQTCNDRMLPNV